MSSRENVPVFLGVASMSGGGSGSLRWRPHSSCNSARRDFQTEAYSLEVPHLNFASTVAR